MLTAAQAEAMAEAAGGSENASGAGQGAAAGGPGGPTGGPGAARGRGPRVEITVTDPDGEVFGSFTGPAEAGLNRATWNMRGAQPESAGPSPYQARQRADISARAESVRDSLVAEGWNEQMLGRMIGMFTGEMSRQQMFAMFSGGGGGARDPEAFRERPGESPPGGGGGMNFGQMRELADILVPGAGMGQLMRMFGGGGGSGQPPLAERAATPSR